jgi:hypothetical protein
MIKWNFWEILKDPNVPQTHRSSQFLESKCAVLLIQYVIIPRLPDRQVWAVQVCDGAVTHPQCCIPSFSAPYSSHGDTWRDAFCLCYEAPTNWSVWGMITWCYVVMRFGLLLWGMNRDWACLRGQSQNKQVNKGVSKHCSMQMNRNMEIKLCALLTWC